MRRAIVLAREAEAAGGEPYGALIADASGTIVAEGRNHASNNPLWHGETSAIANLSRLINTSVYDVAGNLTLYTTAEPCPMCMGAILWSGFSTVIYGTSIPYLTAQGRDQIAIRADALARATPFRNISIIGGVLRNETDPLYACRTAHVHTAPEHAGRALERQLRRVLGGRDRWTAKGIGVYDDTHGSPPIAMQLEMASDLVGPSGWVVLFLQPVVPGPPPLDDFVAKLRAAYAKGLRVVVRIGWSGAMRDYADPSSNATAYTRVAEQIADVVAQLPLPPPDLLPLLVHAGNELNACNEWRCVEPAGVVFDLATRAREVGGFMDATMTRLGALAAARNGSVSLAHASIANWNMEGCVCGSNDAVGAGSPGTAFLAELLRGRPALYAPAQWLSSHSYPYSNSNYSTDPQSKAYRGLTYYRAERAVLNKSLPAVLTETGWARASSNNPVSEADQADWTRRAADEIWRRDPSVLAVAPFLLAGRLWEDAGIGGWTFADCPPGAIDAPCDGALTPRAVLDAWRSL